MAAPAVADYGRSMDVTERPGCVAVIGAGPHGLSALKALLQAGIPADGFDRADDLGGNWNFGAPTAGVRVHAFDLQQTVHPVPDFPMPDDYPDYPSHRQVKAYFDAYAAHFGLRERITFNTSVVRVEAVDVQAPAPQWDVTVERDGKQAKIRYDGVVVANGHNWNPKIPQYPGEFGGEVLHSADYKVPDQLRGRRVLVVGAGNTGCDIAVEAAQNATATFHSTRRGYYYNPKFVFGKPSDQIADQLWPCVCRWPCAACFRRDVAHDDGQVRGLRSAEARPCVLRDPSDRQPATGLLRGSRRHHPKPDIEPLRRRRRGVHRWGPGRMSTCGFRDRVPGGLPFLADQDALDAAQDRPNLRCRWHHRSTRTCGCPG